MRWADVACAVVGDRRRRPPRDAVRSIAWWPASRCATTRRGPTSSTTRSSRRCCSRSTGRSTSAGSIAVDYDDRDLRPDAPNPCVYRLPDAPVKDKTFWTRVERDLVDHLVRSRTVDVHANRDLKMFGRPGESAEDFTARCLAAADDMADKRDRRAPRQVRRQGHQAADPDSSSGGAGRGVARRSARVAAARSCCRPPARSSAACSAGAAAGGRARLGARQGRQRRWTAVANGGRRRPARRRREQDRVAAQQLEDLEAELGEEVTDIDAKWMAAAKNVSSCRSPWSARTSR